MTTNPADWPSPSWGPDRPLRPWGSALAKPPLEFITVRPRRFTDPALRGPPCPVCGDDGPHFCDCEEEL